MSKTLWVSTDAKMISVSIWETGAKLGQIPNQHTPRFVLLKNKKFLGPASNLTDSIKLGIGPPKSDGSITALFFFTAWRSVLCQGFCELSTVLFVGFLIGSTRRRRAVDPLSRPNTPAVSNATPQRRIFGAEGIPTSVRKRRLVRASEIPRR